MVRGGLQLLPGIQIEMITILYVPGNRQPKTVGHPGRRYDQRSESPILHPFNLKMGRIYAQNMSAAEMIKSSALKKSMHLISS